MNQKAKILPFSSTAPKEMNSSEVTAVKVNFFYFSVHFPIIKAPQSKHPVPSFSPFSSQEIFVWRLLLIRKLEGDFK